MLSTIQLHGHSSIGAEQINLKVAQTIERNRKRSVQLEPFLCFGQRLETPIEERFRRTPRPRRIISIGGNRTSHEEEQTGQRGVNAVANKPTHAPGVVTLPYGVCRK